MQFDAPLFKLLAHNDTGQAVGHQGGIVIPRDLDPYFPQLSRSVTEAAPTVEEFIVADLYVGSRYLGTVDARYQFQTWGGARSPERRLTRNLAALRNLAEADDMLVIERSLDSPTHYRLRLIKQQSEEYAELLEGHAGARWGVLNAGQEPLRETLVENELEALELRGRGNFALFDELAALRETRQQRMARSRAFQRHVSALYDFKCAVCGSTLRHPAGRFETQSAHIVPRHKSGVDDARNGVQLCRTHHWAFDEGLFGISVDYRVIAPDDVLEMPHNAALRAIAGKNILLPGDRTLAPHPSALEWHLNNTLFSAQRGLQ